MAIEKRKEIKLTKKIVIIALAVILVFTLFQFFGCAPKVSRGIVVGYDQEPAILNPFITGGDMMATADVIQSVSQGLFTVDNTLKYVPVLLAEVPSMENGGITQDPFTITYKLKKGIKWSDGKPLTSADIKFTWETIMNPDNQILSRDGYDKIESIETPDDQTAVVKFKEIYAPWKNLFSPPYAVLPMHWLEGKDFNQAMNRELLGSGPYMFKEWVSGDSITLVRNPKYWDDPKPTIESITFKYNPETNTLVTMLQSGEVDMIIPPPDVALIEQLKAIEGVKVDIQGGLIWEHLAFGQNRDTVLRDVNIRKAICHAVDRQSIVNELLKGQVNVLQSIYVSTQPVYIPAWEQYDYNIDKAKEYLAKSGYGPDNPIDLKISTTAGNVLREQLEQIIQANLKEIGINITIENFDPDTWFGEKTPTGEFDIGEWAWLVSPDPDLAGTFAGDMIPPDGQNYYWYNNDQVTTLLHDANKQADEAKRFEMYKEVQRLMAEDAIILPLYQRLNVVAYNSALKGVKANPSQIGTFWNTEEWTIEE